MGFQSAINASSKQTNKNEKRACGHYLMVLITFVQGRIYKFSGVGRKPYSRKGGKESLGIRLFVMVKSILKISIPHDTLALIFLP